MCAHKEEALAEFWLPRAMASRRIQFKSPTRDRRGPQALAENHMCFFTLPRQWSFQTGASIRVPEAAKFRFFFFFEWNLINYCQLICNLWDNANEAYDFSSELNSKLLGLSRKCNKTGPVPPAGYVDFFGGQATQTLAVPENGCFVQPELEGTCTWMIFNGDSASVVLLPTWN